MMLSVFTDGGSRGNPGPAAIGVVVYSGKEILHEHGEVIGVTTNNVAEYKAVLYAIQFLSSSLPFPPEKVSFFLDSKLVVEQLSGNYKIKNEDLLDIAKQIFTVIRSLPFPVSFTHVPRNQNAYADSLVNKALDAHL